MMAVPESTTWIHLPLVWFGLAMVRPLLRKGLVRRAKQYVAQRYRDPKDSIYLYILADTYVYIDSHPSAQPL